METSSSVSTEGIHRVAKHLDHSSVVTIVAIGIIAYACNDTIHELVGHGIAAIFLGIKVTSVSSVGLQSFTSSRVLSAAGSIANVFAGVLSFLWLRYHQQFDETHYFIWLFGFVNAMNGTCYLLASALLNTGDWSVVIAGLSPTWAWRVGMGVVGLGLYLVFVRWAEQLIRSWIEAGQIDKSDLWWITFPAYLAGGCVMTLASIFNPFSRSLILLSGIGASFGLTWGLLLIPSMIPQRSSSAGANSRVLAFSWKWTGVAALVGIAFVALFGPGLRFK